MPRILPEYIDVSWPQNEGAIGVVGVAPWATLDFCRKIYELTHATKDWQYPRLIIDANTKIPSRGRHLELGERDPSPFIKSTINELADTGATLAVVPCNTAHILFDRWGKETRIPVISIIEATVRQLPVSSHVNTAILGSRYVAESQIYQKALANAGHTTVEIQADEQELLNECIAHLKCSPYLNSYLDTSLLRLISRLIESGTETVVLACTELSIISQSEIWGHLSVIDSNEALAFEVLKTIGIRRV